MLFSLGPPYWGWEGDYGPGVFERADFERLSDQLSSGTVTHSSAASCAFWAECTKCAAAVTGHTDAALLSQVTLTSACRSSLAK
ncbi:MAG: hypothetical protein ACRYFW_02870 [Janthinobacterium lividum]